MQAQEMNTWMDAYTLPQRK